MCHVGDQISRKSCKSRWEENLAVRDTQVRIDAHDRCRQEWRLAPESAHSDTLAVGCFHLHQQGSKGTAMSRQASMSTSYMRRLVNGQLRAG